MSPYSRVRHPATGNPREDVVRRAADGAFVPADPLNHDWQAYQAWLEAGGTPADPGEPDALSRERHGDAHSRQFPCEA